MQYLPLEMHAAALGRAKALGMKKVEPTDAEPRGSAVLPLTSSAFQNLHAAMFPHYTKASERGRGETRLLTTPRLTLHKIIHHDASPATEQSHENSHLLQFS